MIFSRFRFFAFALTSASLAMQSQDKSYIEKLFGLEGKVALVTGGGQGIGFMITTSLIKAGMKVYIASRKQKVSQNY